MLQHNQDRTFHPFLRLPFELRLMIWEKILHQPTIFEAFPCCKDQAEALKPRSHPPVYPCHPPAVYPMFRTHTYDSNRCPILLRICKESRELGSRSYEICLSAKIDPKFRFPPIRDVGKIYNMRDWKFMRFETLASYLLPSSINAERAKRSTQSLYLRRKQSTYLKEFCFSLS